MKNYLTRSLFFITLSLLLAESVQAAVIKKVNLQTPPGLDETKLRELLGIKEGEAFSAAALDIGLKRIAETGRFSEVKGELKDDATLDVVIESIDVLTDIEINLSTEVDDPDFIKSDIRESLGVKVGDPIMIESVQSLREKLAARLADRGYSDAKIVLLFEETDKKGFRRLLVTVDLGPRTVIRDLHLKNFSRRDVEELLDELKSQNEIDQFLRNFALPADLLGFSQDIIENKVKGSLYSNRAESTLIRVNLPADWIALGQSLNAWAQKARDKGYFDFQVKIAPESGSREMIVAIELSRGLRYDLQIKNNVEFWERDLRQRVEDRSRRLGIPLNVNEAELMVKRLYQEKGFQDVAIEVSTKDTALARKVVFNIHEGKQYFLRTLSLDGVPRLAKDEVDKSLYEWRQGISSPLHRTYFDEKLIQSQLPDFISKLRNKGYLGAKVVGLRRTTGPQERFVDLELSIQLGPKYFVRNVAVSGNIYLREHELDEIVNLSSGDVVNPSQIAEINANLLKRYRDLGFIYAKVTEDESKIFKFDLDDQKVDIELQIEPGPHIFVGKIIVSGLQKTKEKVVLREFDQGDIKSGNAWSPFKVDAIEQRLLGLGIFSSAHSEVSGAGRILEQKNASDQMLVQQEKDLKVQVAERPAGALEFGPGYRTDLGLIGFAEFNYRNIGGWNRSILLRSQLSRKLSHYNFVEQNFSIAYLEPYLFDLPLRLRLDTSYIKEDQNAYVGDIKQNGFNDRQLSFGAAIERDLSTNLKGILSVYRLTFLDIYDLVGTVGTELQRTFPYRIGSTGFTLIYDTRDNFFNPTRGWVLNSTVQYGTPLLGGSRDANFISLHQNISRYFPIFSQSSIVLQLNYGYLNALGDSQNIPQTERFVLGGRSSIRSLDEKQLKFDVDGVIREQEIDGKIEYRQPIFQDLGIAYFLDFGVVDVLGVYPGSAATRQVLPLRKGAGVGIRYGTPVGPLALDFAFNLDQQPQESLFKVQVSIGSF